MKKVLVIYMVWEHRHTKLPLLLTDNYYQHKSLSSDYQTGHVITTWVQTCGSVIMREIEGSSHLWHCAVSNGGYGRCESVVFFHVQNLDSPGRINWAIKGKPPDSFFFKKFWQYRFLPCPFQFIIHSSYHHWTIYTRIGILILATLL